MWLPKTHTAPKLLKNLCIYQVRCSHFNLGPIEGRQAAAITQPHHFSSTEHAHVKKFLGWTSKTKKKSVISDLWIILPDCRCRDLCLDFRTYYVILLCLKHILLEYPPYSSKPHPLLRFPHIGFI